VYGEREFAGRKWKVSIIRKEQSEVQMLIGGMLCVAAFMLLGSAIFWDSITAPIGGHLFTVMQYLRTPDGREVAIASLFLVVAVAWMNGFSRTDLVLAHRSPEWYRKHWFLAKFHHINSEGEMAGIILGLIVLWYLIMNHLLPHDFHWPITESLTLVGIMSAAILCVPRLIPLLGLLERMGGVKAVVFGTSMASAVSGEPAAAVILSRYLKPRIKPENKAKVASGIAATIGSGGGWLPFAAPPILIIWPVLQAEFGWDILTLLKFMIFPCALHCAAVTWRVIKAIEPAQTIEPSEQEEIDFKGLLGPLGLLALVLFHIGVSVYESGVVHSDGHHGPSALVMNLWLVDGLVGLVNILYCKGSFERLIAKKKSDGEALSSAQELEEHENELEVLHEEAFSFTWQPLILGFLLVALEIIGVGGQAAPIALGGLIPSDWSVFPIMMALFFATATVSHFADNALASRVFIIIAIGLREQYGAEVGDMMAVSVAAGALWGGFLMIPANLPNFAIARILGVDPGAWVVGALRWYLSAPVYVAALFLLHLVYLS
jgi:hypothetical protein